MSRDLRRRIRPWLRASLQPATLLGVALLAVVWAGLAVLLSVERGRTLEAAEQETGNIARLFEESTVRMIEGVDRALLILRRAYEGDPAGFDLKSWTEATGLIGSATTQISMIGPDGFMTASTIAYAGPRLDLRDREHFLVHRVARDDELFISKPVLGRASGKWSIQLTRRLRAADGGFGGVIVASIDPDFVARFYRSIDLGRQGSVNLRGIDGVVRASHGLAAPAIGLRAMPPVLRDAIEKAPAGHFRGGEAADGVDRLVAFRVVEHYPLIVTVGLGEQDIFAAYARNRNVYVGTGLALSVLVLVVIGASIGHRVRIDAAGEALRTSEATAREKSHELQVTLDHMSQGIVMIDADRRIPVVNRRAVELLGLPEEFLYEPPTFDEVLQFQWATGEFGRDGEALDPRTRAYLNSGGLSDELKVYERTRPDGTIIEVRSVPLLGGGVVRTYTDVTERRRAERDVVRLAHHDPLTGVANRLLLRERAEQALAGWRRDGEGFAVLCIDLDRFKPVNDTLGHPTGDALLVEVAGRLRDCVREVDTVARLGGDEFVVLQLGAVADEDVTPLAKRILQAVSAPYQINGNHVAVGASIGVALAPRDGDTADTLLGNADLALYRVKADGRNGWRFFAREMSADAQRRGKLELELREAMRRGEFELHYQPWVELATGRVGGCEALLRWRSPRRGLVPPDEFVPIAEEIGLIGPLGEWVLLQATADAARWPRGVKVAVNLSAAQFVSGQLLGNVMDALAASGLPPERLELEITESLLMAEEASSLSVLHQLRNHGVEIALDDFGTGYSSLKYLRAFPFDRLKIDKGFVHDMATRSDCAAIVAAVAGLGRSLGMAVTAEGVETPEQRTLLRAAGATHLQGYLVGRPVTASEIARLWSHAATPARAPA